MIERAWTRNPAVLWRRTTDHVVLLPPDADAPTVLGGSAGLLWDLLEEPTTLEEATEVIALACAADRTVVGSELEVLVATLAAAGIVRGEPA